MSLTGHLKGGVVATLAVTLSGGCIPYPGERPGYIDLCKSGYEFNIDSLAGRKASSLKPGSTITPSPAITCQRNKAILLSRMLRGLIRDDGRSLEKTALIFFYPRQASVRSALLTGHENTSSVPMHDLIIVTLR